MSKKKILCLGLLAVVLVIFLFCFYQKWRVDHAIIKVTLKDALEAEVYSEVKVSDFIEEINGTLVKDEKIDTSKRLKFLILLPFKSWIIHPQPFV